MQTYDKKTVLYAINRGLQAFYDMARNQVYRGRWYKNLSRANQLRVGRAVFALRDMAANPSEHFSRNLDRVQNDIDAAFWNDYELRAFLTCFCERIADWYANPSDVDAQQIVKMSRQIRDMLSIARDGRIVHYVNKAFDHPALQRLVLGRVR